MTFQKLIIYVLLFSTFSSCSFNGTFHRPDRIVGFEELDSYYVERDSIRIEYNQSNGEIILYDKDLNVKNEYYEIKNIFFYSSNGNRLNGWWLSPKGIKPVATILHFHGSAGNLLTQYELIDPLVEFGYKVFMFDYSGYGNSEGRASHQVALEDGYSALEYVTNQTDSRIIVYGQSYGGYLASIIGSNSQEMVDGVVIEGAFTSLKDEARHKAGMFGHFVKNWISADIEIQKNRKPILVIHSKEDEMVPIKLGRQIFDNANDPKDFYEIDGAHIKALELYPEEIADKINRILVEG